MTIIIYFCILPTTNGACDIPYFRDCQLSTSNNYQLPMELATSRIFGTTNYQLPTTNGACNIPYFRDYQLTTTKTILYVRGNV